MTPFYFGPAERRLFGIYQPSAQSGTGNRSAVLCYPQGNEYIYAHRAMRRLAHELSLAGFHTLRFDFFGTGDSGGETACFDPVGWETDVETALCELNEIAGATQATLIGLRSGAATASRVAKKRPNGIAALVLWDPVVHGTESIPQIWSPDGNACPERTLVVITDRHAWHILQPKSTTTEAAENIRPEFVEDVQPWLEESSSTGRMPIKVIEHIRAWLR